MNEYVIQGIGFIGVVLFVVSYQIKSNRALFLCQLLGCIVFSTQFFIMGAYTGALSLMVNIIRNVLLLLSKNRTWARSKLALCAILLLLTVVTVYTWAGRTSLLPSFSVAVTTLGYWTQNAQKIRLSQLIGSPCALAYDVVIRSWGGVMNESIVLLSILVSILRFGWKNLADETS